MESLSKTQACIEYYRKNEVYNTRFALTLVEVLIVVAILGIFAAVIIPEITGHSQKAKESTAKENIRLLRESMAYNLDIRTDPNSLYKLSSIPENPFNKKNSIEYIFGEFPAEATGTYGWLFQGSSKIIRLDWPGTDSKGVRYYDY